MKLRLLLLLVFFGSVLGTRRFFRGKLFEAPVRELGASDDTLWFDQLLDHFEPTNDATWKQVLRSFNLILLSREDD